MSGFFIPEKPLLHQRLLKRKLDEICLFFDIQLGLDIKLMRFSGTNFISFVIFLRLAGHHSPQRFRVFVGSEAL